MYISFVRPQLEYAVEIWYGCTKYDIKMLEKVQLYAARIVTSLSIITSRTSLYLETGWKPLVNRRNRSKLSTMNKLVPSYPKGNNACHQKGKSACHQKHYFTLQYSNQSLSRCRLEVFNKSVFFYPQMVCSQFTYKEGLSLPVLRGACKAILHLNLVS